MEKEKEISDAEWEQSIGNIDAELKAEEDAQQLQLYEINRNTKYFVSEYKMPPIVNEDEGDKLEIINSTEVVGLDNAEKKKEELEELHLNDDTILVYIEEENEKGILAA